MITQIKTAKRITRSHGNVRVL